MLHQSRAWTRGLRLYEAQSDISGDREWVAEPGPLDGVHARSRFRSLSDPEHFALYSMEGGESRTRGTRAARGARGRHTLIVVREFRRVPLDASTLALVVFNARPGYAAPIVAALAEFTGHAVSFYQPAYVLLAHSLEDPQTIVLLTGVQDCAALQAASTSAFSIERLVPELSPMLAVEPEVFMYCPDRAPDSELEPVISRRIV